MIAFGSFPWKMRNPGTFCPCTVEHDNQLCVPEQESHVGPWRRATDAVSIAVEAGMWRAALLSRTSTMRSLLLALFGICFLTEFIVEGVGSEVLERSICMSLTTKRLPVKSIKTYTIKEGSMRAVIFITRRGFKFCADPQADWVKKAVESVDKSTRRNMKQTKPTGAQLSTNTAVTLTT
ncbi:lymphotactin isoform X18 [Canis lupus familiaris]|uniref:lymphotactin isoform X14 n=1 Tax=Canis lupus familiaris TaxID=9615 RepID=UPI0018F31A87|nr:lymphotactin isoform X14 [Canis lupus familiaris]XP_038423279.1 lymphotactin isoform X18 [Canis lupus familiaris]XP_038527366.1 lymphotactin isoform X5 [Canis lupus familiaris]